VDGEYLSQEPGSRRTVLHQKCERITSPVPSK
jgi:hypothetical protein